MEILIRRVGAERVMYSSEMFGTAKCCNHHTGMPVRVDSHHRLRAQTQVGDRIPLPAPLAGCLLALKIIALKPLQTSPPRLLTTIRTWRQ